MPTSKYFGYLLKWIRGLFNGLLSPHQIPLEVFHCVPMMNDRRRLMEDTIIANLPAVETATLPEGEHSCPICTETYVDIPRIAAIRSQEAPESAIRLRCNHVFGKTCLKTWLESGITTCPFCRDNIFSQEEMEKTARSGLDDYVLRLIFTDNQFPE